MMNDNPLKKQFELFSELPVKLVAIPLPPTPVGNLLFLPNAYASKTYDRNFELNEKTFKLITLDFHPQLGMILLLTTKLKHLIDWRYHPDQQMELLQVSISTFCASVSYYKRENEEGLVIADEIVLDELNSIGRSCHPGSHYVIPRAPSLTALLQFAQAPEDYSPNRCLTDFTYLSPMEGERLFPTANWRGNESIEDYISKCPADVSIFRTLGGPGKWAKDVLRQLSLNRITNT